MRTRLERFLILFSRLRNETNNSPGNLKWLPKQKQHLAGLCYDLDSCYREIVRFLSKKYTKHTITPTVFSKNWDDYAAHWQDLVAEAAKPEEERVRGEYRKILRQIEGKAIAEGKTKEEFWKDFEKDFTPRDIGATFDPLIEDPAAVMKNIMMTIYDIVENALLEGVFDDKTLGAWLFYEQTIGVDYSGIYARWRKVPEMFIPDHTLHQNITAIAELYNEAVRAYVYGLSAASVSMCRALLEHVLEKHYNVRGINLENVISIAEARYSYLKGLKLQRKRRLGNKVLHKYENKAESLDKAVLDFLLTLRKVVTHIPLPNPHISV